VIVGLVGQLPIQVSTANGPIHSGDSLTVSDVPGVAMKASNAGIVIGRAITEYNAAGTDTINAYINVGFADPNNSFANLHLDQNGNISTKSIALSTPLQINGQTLNGTLDDAIVAMSDVLATHSAQITQTNSVMNGLNEQIASAAVTLSSLSTKFGNLFSGFNSAYTGSQSAVTVNYLGNVGIGTIIPGYKLDIQNASTSAVAQIYNQSTDANSVGLQIKLGVTSPATTNRFINFTDANGQILGSVRGNGTSNTITFDGNGGDFAEYFQKANYLDTFDAGDLVCHGANGGVEKCNPTSNGILGVLSDDASFVGAGRNENDPNYVLIGLIGQLKVKVSSDSEAIKTGDPITFSPSQIGKAIKATEPGQIVGRAMEAFDPQHPTDKIMVALNVTWYDPEVALTDGGNVSVAGKPLSNTQLTLAVNTLQTKTSDLSTLEATTSAALQTHENTIASLQSQIASLSGQLSAFSSPTASGSSQFINLSWLGGLTDRVTNLEKAIATTQLATNALSTSDATISGTLTVTGRALFSDVGITGNANIGLLTINGLDNSNGEITATLNTSAGPLKIQSLGLNGVDFENGKVTIDTKGTIKTKSDVNIGGNINLEGGITITATAGEDLKAGDALYISSSNTVKKADVTSNDRNAVAGFAASDAKAGQQINVIIGGKAKGFKKLQAGKRYYLGVGGTIVTNPTTNSKLVSVGIALSESELIIQIGQDVASAGNN
jgi:hypothetical protein